MASNDNIDLTIRAKLDDKASKDLKNLSGSIDKIKGEVTTTAKADTSAAENKVKTYKDKLDSIQKSVSTKVVANTKSAHASIENLKRKLDAFDKKNYDVKVSVKADGDIKAISSLSRALQTLEKRTKDFSINVDMGSTEKVAKNLENVVDRIKAIDKNAHISFSSEGFNGLSSELKEIYGLLKGINKYKDVNVSGRANISRQRATSNAIEKEEDGFKSYQQQLSSIAIRGQKAHQNGDIEQLHALGNEYAFVSKEMQDYVAKMGMVDYNGQAKMMTPVIQRLQEYGVIAKDNYGILDKLKASQREFDNNLVAKADFTTASEKVRANRGLAEQALNNGDTAGYQAHLAEAEKYKAIQQKITDEMKHQVDLEIAKGRSADEVNATLNQRIKALQTIAQDSYSRGMTNDAKEIGTQIMELKQKKLELEAMQAKSPYEQQRKEAQVISAKLAVELDKNKESQAVNDLRAQLVSKTMQATETGIESGAIAASTAISRYNAMIPIAVKIKDEQALQELQSRITALGGTPITVRVNDNGAQQQIKTLGQVYKELQVQAVQAADKLNDSFKNNQGIEEAKKELDDVLRKIKEIKQANGDFTYGGQADLLKRLATRYNPTSDTYAELTTRAKKSRGNQREINSDSGDSERGGFTVAGAGAYITRFIGRSSKGWGSFGEAMSQAVVDMSKLSESTDVVTRAFGKMSAPLGVLLGAMAIGVGVFQSTLQMIQVFGNTLVNIGRTIYQALQPGIELYKNQTSAMFSFGAAILSNGYDKQGNKLQDSLQNKNDIFGVSNQLVSRAQIDAEMSAFSLDDILKSLQGTLPVLMSKGMTLNQAYDVNEGVAGVAKMLQLAPSQILQETRDLAQGSITARGSQVAGALGVTNQDLAGKSADQIFDFLMEKFKNYSDMLNQFEDTALGRAQQLDERLSMVGKAFVEELAGGFKSIAEYIIGITGKYVDKDENGNQIAHLDSISGHWYSDKEGEEGADLGTEYSPQNAGFELSDGFQKAADILQEIIGYIADAIDEVITFVEETTSIGDPLEFAKEILELIIDGLVIGVKILISMVDTALDVANAMETVVPVISLIGKLCQSVWAMIKMVFNAIVTGVRMAIYAIDGLLSYIPGVKVNLDGDFNGVLASMNDVKANVDGIFTPWTKTPFSSNWSELFGLNNKGDGTFGSLWREGLKKGDGRPKNTNGLDMSKIRGNQNSVDKDADKKAKKAQREADKARREAIRESQRMLKERQQALKEVLEDKLQELKDTLKKNEIAYKEGFKSIGEYFTQKAELEKQEAQARLEEAQQEREAIANSKFDSEYQKLSALHKVDREIRKYTRELSNATKAQQGVANILTQYKNTMNGSNLFGTLNRVNSGTNRINGGTQTNNKLLGVWKPKNDRSNDTDSKLWDLAFKETEEAHKRGYVVNPGVFRGIHQEEAQEAGILTSLATKYNNYWGLKYDANNAAKYNMYDSGTWSGNPKDPGNYAGFYNIEDGIRAFFDNYIDHKGTSYLEEIANASNDGYAVAQIMYNNGYFSGSPYAYGQVMSEYTDEYNSWGLPAVVDVFGNSLQANTQAVQSNTQVISAKKAQSIADLNSTIEYAITGTPEEVAKDITAPTVQMLNDADNWIRAHNGTTIWTSGNRTWGGHTTHTKADIQSGIFNNSSTRREFVKYMASIGWAANNEYDYPSSYATGPHMDLDSTGNKWVTADNISVDTSKTGMGSTTLNNLQQAREDTTDLEQQMREALNKFIEEYNSVVEEIRANIFGEMPDVTVKFRETFKKLRDAKNIAGTNKDALALVEKLKIQIRQQIAKTVTDFYMAMLETNLDRVQETGQDIANKFATGSVDNNQIKDFYKRYFGYFFGEGQNIDVMKKRLEELKSKQAEYEKKYMNGYFGVDARDEKALKDAGNHTREQYLKAKEHQYSTLNEQLYKVNNNKDATEEEIKTANLMVKTARREVQGLYKLFDKEAHPYKDEIAKLEKSIELAMQTPLNQMISLEEQFAEMQRLGNVDEAQKIRRRLESARNTLYGIYDNWIKAIESKYDFESNYFEQMPVTNLQKEQGNRLLSAYKNKELAYANQQKLDLLNNQYMYRLEKISEYENKIKDLEKTNARGLHDNKWADRNAQIARLNDKIQGLKFATGELYKQIGDTTQIIRLEKELAKIPTLLQNIGKVAKQSLEDNLVTFLTDGVNEAKSFKEAFGNMLMGILKDIQTFLAKETARDLMTALFGHYHSEGIGNGDSKGNMYEKASAQAVKEIQTNDSHTRQQLETFANGEGILGSNLYTTYRYDVDKYKNAKAPKLQTPYFMSEQYKKSLNQPKYSFKLSDNPFTISGSTVSKTLDADTTKKILYDTRNKSKQIEQSIDVDKLGADTQAVVDRLNGINSTLQTIDSHITGKPVENKQVQENTEQLKETAKVQEETSKASVETVEKAQEQSAQEVAQEAASNTTTQAQISSATVSVDSAKVATENATNAINSNTEQKEAETSTNTVGTTSAGNIGTASQNIGTTLGNSFANMMQPITNAVSSFTNNITGFLNNGAFSSLLSSFDGLAGSAGAQLGGSVFAVSSLMKGDKKEKLLSMIYIELQLIYNALISKASGFATGGYISGIGTSTSDSIPAMLSNGEYVVKASSVRKYGTNFLNAVNDGSFSRIPNLINVPKFADGGEVAAQETARGMSTFASTLGTNVSSTTNMNVALVSNQEEAIAHFMRSPRGQRIMLDFTRGSAKFTNKIVGAY